MQAWNLAHGYISPLGEKAIAVINMTEVGEPRPHTSREPAWSRSGGWWCAARALLFLLSASSLHAAAEVRARVEFKNAEAQAVMVPLGRNQGVSEEDDFEVLDPEGRLLARIYPHELHDDLFWSQTLSPSVYRQVVVGTSIRDVSLAPGEHSRVRREGSERWEALRTAREESRLEALKAEIEALRRENDELEARRDAVERKLQRAEENLLEAEAGVDLTALDEEDDVDRILADVEGLLAERDEIQARREILAEQDPLPRNELDRLTAEIERLNSRLEQRRRRIRSSRDRARGAQRKYVEARRQWGETQAEYRALTTRIRSNLDRIRDLTDRL